ncbi:AzlD domain-containing protein [Acinetobacter pittii]|uniref:AzlD family protein n=1 Tax=Acinetobacter pittii TaxID=48296 RepID=UPI001C214634|nr:AzlD domain-containing protein [Acinetobacter pittii]QXA09007.1 AzlD domain-containing protein [Acinetobacter pittii]
MISSTALLTILGMAIVTYLTRLLGFLLLRNRILSPRTKSVLECAPGCVIISVIAPYYVSSQPEIVIAMLIATICALRLSMLPTLVISVISLGILQKLFN